MQNLDTWQFRISVKKNNDAIKIGTFFLEIGPGIECINIFDKRNVDVGKLIGFPIDLETESLIQNSHRFNFLAEVGIDEFANKVVRSLAGRFLLILEMDGLTRVYPDAFSQIPCVYCPEKKIAGSTSYAILSEEEYWNRFDQELYNFLDITGEGWFVAGLTAHDGVVRVLPNHYLDLETWETRRFWPISDIKTLLNPSPHIPGIVSLIHAQINALTKSGKKAAIGLTAGHETRMLLGCAKPFLADITFLTVTGSDRHAVDTIISRWIAKKERLSHLELPRVEATSSQQDLYLRRGGHCVGDSNALYHPTVWPLAEDHILAAGLGGEIGRAFFWRASDTSSTPFSAARLIGRMGLPTARKIEEHLEEWRSNLPTTDSLLMLDLAYQENRMGGWAAPQFYCDPTLVRIAPLNTRHIVEFMLALPSDWKRSDRMCDEIVRQTWPELAEYPYNSLGKCRDTLNQISRVLRNPAIILKKLRKLRR